MSHNNTIIGQVLQMFSRHEFQNRGIRLTPVDTISSGLQKFLSGIANIFSFNMTNIHGLLNKAIEQ